MYSTRIYYQDTDAGGVVYYANYLRFFEKSWFEYLMSIGISLPEWESEGTYIIIKEVHLDLVESLRYGDYVTIITEIVEVKRASFVLSHLAMKDSTLTTRCTTRIACIDKNGKPKRMPDDFRNKLLEHTKNG